MRISDWSSDVCSSDLDRRRLVERQADAEMILFDGQVPEAILEDDRHLVGIFGDQMARNRDAGRLRLEGDIEMMHAGQAVAAHDLRQHAADHGAQRILHDRSEGHKSELQSLMRTSYAVFCMK